MDSLLIGILSALVATNQPTAVSNLIADKTGLSVSIPDPNDPAEKDFEKLLGDEEAAQAEVDQWIRELRVLNEKDEGPSTAALHQRIKTRLERVRKAYESFLRQHPKHTRARLSYASFLSDIREFSSG